MTTLKKENPLKHAEALRELVRFINGRDEHLNENKTIYGLMNDYLRYKESLK